MQGTSVADRNALDVSTSRAIAWSSLVELVWSAGALTAAGLGIAGYEPRTMAALAPLAFGFALVARSAALALRWPRPDRLEQVGVGSDGFGAVVCLGLGGITLWSEIDAIVLVLPALMLGALLVTDGPIQAPLVGAAPGDRGIAGITMSVSGLAAIALALTALILVHTSLLILLAMACIGIGHVVATGSAVWRFARHRDQARARHHRRDERDDTRAPSA